MHWVRGWDFLLGVLANRRNDWVVGSNENEAALRDLVDAFLGEVLARAENRQVERRDARGSRLEWGRAVDGRWVREGEHSLSREFLCELVGEGHIVRLQLALAVGLGVGHDCAPRVAPRVSRAREDGAVGRWSRRATYQSS